MSENPSADATEADLREAFEATDYVAEDGIVTTVLLALRLERPLLVEGEPVAVDPSGSPSRSVRRRRRPGPGRGL